MGKKGLRLQALMNQFVERYLADDSCQANTTAMRLFALTHKSLSTGMWAPINARDLVQRHHWQAMAQLKEAAGAQDIDGGSAYSSIAAPATASVNDPSHSMPPKHFVDRARRLKELNHQLRQAGQEALQSVRSARAAHQLCRMFRLGDEVYRRWEQQCHLNASNSGGSSVTGGSGGGRFLSPSPRKRSKRKTPDRAAPAAGRSRFATECGSAEPQTALPASGAGEEVPRRRRSSSEDEPLVRLPPKQLFGSSSGGGGNDCGDRASSSYAARAAELLHASTPQDGTQQREQHKQQKPPCEQWLLFKQHMASPQRPSTAVAAAAAVPRQASVAAPQPSPAQSAAPAGAPSAQLTIHLANSSSLAPLAAAVPPAAASAAPAVETAQQREQGPGHQQELEQLQQRQQQGEEQPMDVDRICAAAEQLVSVSQAVLLGQFLPNDPLLAGGNAPPEPHPGSAAASLSPTQPLSPRQLAPWLSIAPLVTPDKLVPWALPAPPHSDGKENGAGSTTAGSGSGSDMCAAAARAAGPLGAAAGSPASPAPRGGSRAHDDAMAQRAATCSHPCAAVDRALLVLQSPATERAAAVQDIIAADIMLMLSDRSQAMTFGDECAEKEDADSASLDMAQSGAASQRGLFGSLSSPDCRPPGTAAMAWEQQAGTLSSSSCEVVTLAPLGLLELRGTPLRRPATSDAAAAVDRNRGSDAGSGTSTWAAGMPVAAVAAATAAADVVMLEALPAPLPAPLRHAPAPVATPRPTRLACSAGGERVMLVDTQAVRRQAAALPPKLGGAPDAVDAFQALNVCGRAHSILCPVRVPLALHQGQGQA